MRKNKKADVLIKDREKMSTPRAEFLLKFAFMSDEQFEIWSELGTSAERRAFMQAISMPQLTKDEVYITLEKRSVCYNCGNELINSDELINNVVYCSACKVKIEGIMEDLKLIERKK